MKWLFILLVLCTVAIIGVGIAVYVHIRKHLSTPVDTGQVEDDLRRPPTA